MFELIKKMAKTALAEMKNAAAENLSSKEKRIKVTGILNQKYDIKGIPEFIEGFFIRVIIESVYGIMKDDINGGNNENQA